MPYFISHLAKHESVLIHGHLIQQRHHNLRQIHHAGDEIAAMNAEAVADPVPQVVGRRRLPEAGKIQSIITQVANRAGQLAESHIAVSIEDSVHPSGMTGELPLPL